MINAHKGTTWFDFIDLGEVETPVMAETWGKIKTRFRVAGRPDERGR
jgi:hypothetical protein